MNKKIVLGLVVILTFWPALLFDFSGDDEIFIKNSSFYSSFKNLPLLFSQQYLPQEQNQSSENLTLLSGSVSYRPVLSLTYFLDYAIWKTNPFGYHLTNVLFHLVNTCLVYVLLQLLLKKEGLAFYSALLFGVHPTKVEAVCAIGYRADLVAGFFVLLSFLFYLRQTRFAYLYSLLFYFLAVFSKEAAFLLPVLFCVYDLTQGKRGELPGGRYLGYCVVAVFYLFTYFVLMPNATLKSTDFMGGNLLSHLLSAAWILTLYLKDLFMPFLTNILPPLYAPDIDHGLVFKLLVSIGVLSLLVYAVIYFWKRDRRVAFFMVWFLVFWIPVSNIVPIVNPMAHRFLYLPSLGLLVVLVLALERLLAQKELSFCRSYIKPAIILVCAVTAFSITWPWRNTRSMGYALVDLYPNFYKGYSILGIESYARGDYESAKLFFLKSIERDSKDFRDYYLFDQLQK